MPLYEYECGSCGTHSEQLHSRHEAATEPCAQCGQVQWRRLVSGFATSLVGGSELGALAATQATSLAHGLNASSTKHAHGSSGCAHHSGGFAERLKKYDKQL
jgi:putative FmdB family regulatory protein